MNRINLFKDLSKRTYYDLQDITRDIMKKQNIKSFGKAHKITTSYIKWWYKNKKPKLYKTRSACMSDYI